MHVFLQSARNTAPWRIRVRSRDIHKGTYMRSSQSHNFTMPEGTSPTSSEQASLLHVDIIIINFSMSPHRLTGQEASGNVVLIHNLPP